MFQKHKLSRRLTSLHEVHFTCSYATTLLETLFPFHCFNKPLRHRYFISSTPLLLGETKEKEIHKFLVFGRKHPQLSRRLTSLHEVHFTCSGATTSLETLFPLHCFYAALCQRQRLHSISISYELTTKPLIITNW